ncbi:MAG: alpha/beta hydrolase [Chloroflexi bacterium]|nr:alpha/beta hydrolase [Chloroflexota bacterium]MQC17438.1 alpha/beta hydrolase [Chloroflexota bacterium]
MTTLVEPEHLTVTINGLRLHYVDYGGPHPDAHTVVLLHGLTSAWGAMRRVAEGLTNEYRVVALDQRGHGESEWSAPDSYTTDAYLSDLHQFIDHLGLDRVILIGQSMGGHHTIAFTARHPERLLASIANDISPAPGMGDTDFSDRYPGGRHPVWATPEAWIAPRREQSPMTPEWAHELAARELLHPVEGGYEPKHDPNAPMRWQPADLWNEARTIQRPLLIIRGGRSTVLDAQTLQDMDMAIPGARSVTLEKAGHDTYSDMEHEWISMARAFLAAHVE